MPIVRVFIMIGLGFFAPQDVFVFYTICISRVFIHRPHDTVHTRTVEGDRGKTLPLHSPQPLSQCLFWLLLQYTTCATGRPWLSAEKARKGLDL